VVSRNKKTSASGDTQGSPADLEVLEMALRETDLLALNATVKSAKDGATGEELFSLLQEIRRQTSNTLDRVLQMQNEAQKAG
jgi:hypothetical protein